MDREDLSYYFGLGVGLFFGTLFLGALLLWTNMFKEFGIVNSLAIVFTINIILGACYILFAVLKMIKFKEEDE